MNARVYVQLPKRVGWILDPHRLVKKVNPVTGRLLPVKLPKTAEEVILTQDVTMSWRFDVDNPAGYCLLKDIMDKGGFVVIAGNYLQGEAPKPSAAPFTSSI